MGMMRMGVGMVMGVEGDGDDEEGNGMVRMGVGMGMVGGVWG